jgi:hypothetical protein
MKKMKVQNEVQSRPISKRRSILDLHSDSFESLESRNETARSTVTYELRTVFTPRLTKGVPEDHNIKTLMKVILERLYPCK